MLHSSCLALFTKGTKMQFFQITAGAVPLTPMMWKVDCNFFKEGSKNMGFQRTGLKNTGV